MTFTLYFEENPNQEDIQVLIRGITDYAKQQRGFDALDFFAFFIRDENNTIVGGCNGGTLYGSLHIDSLWVSDTIRNKGWGTKLVDAALTYGKENNCNFATVNTMDWEALNFYKKLGFNIEFQRSGFHRNSVFYFLRKEFLQADSGIPKSDQIEKREYPGFSINTVENLNVIFEKTTPENALLMNLYRQAEDYFFRGISSKCLDLDDVAHAYMTGEAGLNFIYITSNTNVLDKILIQGKEFYDQDKLSFEIIIPQPLCTPQTTDILNAMGYSQQSNSVSMIMDLNTFVINKRLNFDAETVIKANNNRLNDWMMPLIGAFESTNEICSIYANIHEQALKKNINLYHFSLYKQEKPIASITLSLINDLARIDDMGTLPEFQGNGYATHLMRYVLSEAKRLGAHYCFLESSDSGLGVYQKLGFEPLFINNIYSKEA